MDLQWLCLVSTEVVKVHRTTSGWPIPHSQSDEQPYRLENLRSTRWCVSVLYCSVKVSVSTFARLSRGFWTGRSKDFRPQPSLQPKSWSDRSLIKLIVHSQIRSPTRLDTCVARHQSDGKRRGRRRTGRHLFTYCTNLNCERTEVLKVYVENRRSEFQYVKTN